MARATSRSHLAYGGAVEHVTDAYNCLP
jgi:hypothetical protein